MKNYQKIISVVMAVMLMCAMMPIAMAEAPKSNFVSSDAQLTPQQLQQITELSKQISASRKTAPRTSGRGTRALAFDGASIYEMICYPLRVNANGEFYIYDGDVEYMYCNNVVYPGYTRNYAGVYYIISIFVFEHGAVYPQRVNVTGNVYENVSLVRQFAGSNGAVNGVFKEYQFIADSCSFAYVYQKGNNYSTNYQLGMSIY